jgi:hypothetical protein
MGCKLSIYVSNINHVRNEAKNDPSKDFSTHNETGTGHEAYNAANYMTMMIMTIHVLK